MHGNAYNFSADVSKKLQNINKLQSEAETEWTEARLEKVETEIDK